ncbi:MAG: GGDEF domain-containing protein [Clostridiales bacterium]|nr:GGDEF domain-containing protein [Clostridiales bacterium]
MIIFHMIQLTLAVFVWFPITTGYNLYYFLVPMASFLMMQYDNVKERVFLTILSILSACLYLLSAILPLNNYMFQTSDVMNRFLSGMSIISIMFPMIVILTKFTKELYLSHATLRKIANTDALTQIINRKALYEQGIHEFEQADNYPKDFTLLLFDIDHFKNINDQFGHPVGDKLLQELTSLVQKHIRAEDIFARYGGEEFAILLRNTNYSTGLEIAEKLLLIISQASFSIDQISIRISVSIGVAQYSKALKDFDHMIEVVDQALYEAKNSGRNQVVSAKHIT